MKQVWELFCTAACNCRGVLCSAGTQSCTLCRQGVHTGDAMDRGLAGSQHCNFIIINFHQSLA
eukprot:scaffold164363_cov14-Tisochrysis_lutea.AAC.2